MSQRPPFWHPSTLISTCFGLGYAPKAPGTVGAGATALVLAGLTPWLNASNYPWLGVALACPIVYAAGVWASRRYMEAVDAHDPGAIVVDEVLGMMVAWLVAWLAVVSVTIGDSVLSGLWNALSDGRGWKVDDSAVLIPATGYTSWFFLPLTITLGAFLLFRLFDIWKPGPVGRIDREFDGPHGVMLDDVAAGVMAGVAWFFLAFAAIVVWQTLAWAQPDTGWQESRIHPNSTLQASQSNDR